MQGTEAESRVAVDLVVHVQVNGPLYCHCVPQVLL